jgi:hypothetical protein
MLGEKIAEGHGQVIGQRVLTVDGAPRMEVSFRDSGSLLGLASSNVGTYWSELRRNGTFYGEGQGIVMGKSGEMATWKGQGIGVPQPDGAIKYRGAIYYQTEAKAWARLNKVAVVFEFDVDKDGNTKGVQSEWL